MKLIFGGVYQGKLSYALTRFGVTNDDVYFCDAENANLPPSKPIFYEIDKWILALVKADADIIKATADFFSAHPNSVIICNDISCGVVPMDPTLRRWRDEVGRFMGQAAQISGEVVRMYCGIPTILKGGNLS